MMNKKSGFKKIFLGFVIVLCLCLSSIFINRNYNLPDFFLKDGILFVDRFLTRPFESYSDEEYNRLITENENLKKKLDNIKNYESLNEELVNEITKLKEVLDINNSLSDRTYINGSVISRGIDYWNDSLIVDSCIYCRSGCIYFCLGCICIVIYGLSRSYCVVKSILRRKWIFSSLRANR